MPNLIEQLVAFMAPANANPELIHGIQVAANQAWNQSELKPHVDAKVEEVRKKAEGEAMRVISPIVKPVEQALGPQALGLLGTLAALQQGRAQISGQIPNSIPLIGGAQGTISQQPGGAQIGLRWNF